jgi:hypothetical protein
MASPIAIVDVAERGRPSRVAWHRPDPERSYPLPGLSGVAHVGTSRGSVDDRRIRRQLTRLGRLVPLLSALEPGRTGICRVTGADAAPNATAFAAARIGDREQHLFTRGVDHVPPDVERVRIVTGLCLWGTHAMRGVSATGEPIDVVGRRPVVAERLARLVEDDRLSLYELESATRLMRLVADLVATLPDQVPVTVTLDVPRVQYYCHLLDAFADGFIGRDLLLYWFDRVDARFTRISELLSRELAACVGAGRCPAVQMSRGLAAVEHEIREHVDAGRAPCGGRLFSVLAGEDPVWRRLADAVEPHGLADLIGCSYAGELLRHSDDLVIAVDDYAESKIYQCAQRLARMVDEPFAAIGLYPLGRVLTSRDGRHGPLFLQDPGHRLVGDDGRHMTPAELVAAAYSDASGVEPHPLAASAAADTAGLVIETARATAPAAWPGARLPVPGPQS